MALTFASLEAFVSGLQSRSPTAAAELERTHGELAESFGPHVRATRDASRRLELYRDRWSL